MTTKESLIAARTRIEDPARFCQKANARNQSGDSLHPTSVDARQWCASGALSAEGISCFGKWTDGKVTFNPVVETLTRAAIEQGGNPDWCQTRYEPHPIVYVNDTLGHEAVLKMFDRAIALADEPTESKGSSGT